MFVMVPKATESLMLCLSVLTCLLALQERNLEFGMSESKGVTIVSAR